MAITTTRVKCEHGYKAIDCPECLRLWAEYMSDMRELDELAYSARLAREALPATDREWEDHLRACGYGLPDPMAETWIDEPEMTICGSM